MTVAFVTLAALAAGLFAPPWPAPWPAAGGVLRGTLALAVAAALAAGLIARAAAVARRGFEGAGPSLALLLTLAAAAAAQGAGGPASPWYPLAYLGPVLLAFVDSPLRAGGLALALAAAATLAAAVGGRLGDEAAPLTAHALVGVVLAAGVGLLLAGERRRRGAPDGTAAGPGPGPEPAEPAGAFGADGALGRILAEVLATQGPDGVVFLAEDGQPGRIRVRCALPDDAPVDRQARYDRDDEAAFRWLWGRRLAISIPAIVPGFRRVPFLLPGTPVQSFLGVPVLQAGEVVGALCVYSRTAGAFGHEQERLLHFAARQLAEAMGQARRLSETSRLAREFETLYRAMAPLATTLHPPDVMREILEAARAIAPCDRAALLLAAGDGSRVALAASLPAADAGAARSVAVAGSRLGAALSQRLTLSYATARERRGGQPLLPRGLGVRQGESSLVVPLAEGERAVGALVLAADRPGAFRGEAARLLEILATHAAVVIERARQFEATEAMANTDPLTGLVNRRRFGERLAEEFARARRAPGPFSLILADLDRFKRVNDTYGHPAGDAVLEQLARRLERRARASDTVGRLGGEEFGLLLVGAGQAGALAMAERVRDDVRRAPFIVDGGVELHLTLSLGVATCPAHASEAEGLLARADDALYRAKRSGRDRVATATEAGRPAPPAPPATAPGGS